MLDYFQCGGDPLARGPRPRGKSRVRVQRGVPCGRDAAGAPLPHWRLRPFDAFYADRFGNWAIAGLQWRHPGLPLAVGVGLPIALGNNTGGGLDALVQIRMSLN